MHQDGARYCTLIVRGKEWEWVLHYRASDSGFKSTW